MTSKEESGPTLLSSAVESKDLGLLEAVLKSLDNLEPAQVTYGCLAVGILQLH